MQMVEAEVAKAFVGETEWERTHPDRRDFFIGQAHKAISVLKSYEYPPVLHWKHVALDQKTRQVTVHGEPIVISPKRYDFLLFFMQNPNRLFTHSQVMVAVWGPGYKDRVQLLRVMVSELRELFGDDFLTTLDGHGYRLDGVNEV